jgi:thiol-disulfide isomerase/thioredoxin
VSKELCPAFSVESSSGEELFWLAKLCEQDQRKALLAIRRYLSGSHLERAPDARMLLALLEMRQTHSWENAWGTIRAILEKDPIGPVEAQIDVAIDDEGTSAPETALEWSKERYEVLLARELSNNPDLAPVSADSVLAAGYDLVHRYYLAAETEKAKNILDEMNRFEASHPTDGSTWGSDDLHWANLEMHAAPEITARKALGGRPGARLIEQGRVELISFFFLGCVPCMEELSELNALQKRYGNKKLSVTGVTTYEVHSYLSPPTQSNVEMSLEKARLKTAPRIGMVIISEQTLATYGVHGFPALATRP